MKNQLYLVEWLDSYGCSATWEPIENCEPKPLLCQSVGWIVHRDKHCVVVIPHLASDNGNVKKQGCGDMTIPTACILRTVPLKVSSRRRRATA